MHNGYAQNSKAELGIVPLIIDAYERFGLTYNGISAHEFLPLTVARGKSSKDVMCADIEQLRKNQYWRPGSALVTAPLICVDVDSRHAVDEGLIRMKAAGFDVMPSAIILNTRKGTAQFQWFLDDVYCHVAKNSAQSIHNDTIHTTMFREVRRSLCMLLHGDVLFMHERMRNPYHNGTGQKVMLLGGKSRRYHLDDINDAMVSIHAKITDSSVVGKYNMKSWIAKQAFNEKRQQGEIEENGTLEPSDFAPNHVIPIGRRNHEAYNSMFAAAMHRIDPSSVIELMRFEGTFTSREKHALVRNVRKAANRKLRLYGKTPMRHDARYDDDIITETYDSMHRSNMMSRKCKSPTTSRIASEYGRMGASAATQKQISTRTSNLRRGSRIGTIRHSMLRSEIIHVLNGDNGAVPKTDQQLRKTIARMHGIATYSDEACGYKSIGIRNARREIAALAAAWVINTMGYGRRRINRIIQQQGAVRGAAHILRLAMSTGFIDFMKKRALISDDMTMNLGMRERTIAETARILTREMAARRIGANEEQNLKPDDEEWIQDIAMGIMDTLSPPKPDVGI